MKNYWIPATYIYSTVSVCVSLYLKYVFDITQWYNELSKPTVTVLSGLTAIKESKGQLNVLLLMVILCFATELNDFIKIIPV